MKWDDNPQLARRTGISRIFYSAMGGPWLSDPYSLETARTVDRMLGKLPPYHYQREAFLPEYDALVFKPLPCKRYHQRMLGYDRIWKEYEFFPQVPRIENGELPGPIYSNGQYSFRARVFPSLDRFPKDWRSFDMQCVYRQIESQRFLRMCNGSMRSF